MDRTARKEVERALDDIADLTPYLTEMSNRLTRLTDSLIEKGGGTSDDDSSNSTGSAQSLL